MRLSVIIASTRPGRKGPAVARWIFDICKSETKFDSQLLDLAEINLPFLDEPEHPATRKYQHEHTKKWSSMIDTSDAFIIVTPEYNYGYPAPLKNALDFLYHEWGFKPVAFVSYGGVAAGTRSVQQLKQIVTAQKMMPIVEAVNIPSFTKYINANGDIEADEMLNKTARGMVSELLRWAEALKELRQKNSNS